MSGQNSVSLRTNAKQQLSATEMKSTRTVLMSVLCASSLNNKTVLFIISKWKNMATYSIIEKITELPGLMYK
jgi:hypothetical protein